MSISLKNHVTSNKVNFGQFLIELFFLNHGYRDKSHYGSSDGHHSEFDHEAILGVKHLQV